MICRTDCATSSGCKIGHASKSDVGFSALFKISVNTKPGLTFYNSILIIVLICNCEENLDANFTATRMFL